MNDEIPSHPATEAPASAAPATVTTDAGALTPQGKLEQMAREMARKGEKEFAAFYKKLTPAQRASFSQINPELRDIMNEADGADTE